jgi:hypothetical protein
VGKIIGCHWFCLVPLIPFAAMLAIHKAFHLSNAVGGVPVGERPPTVAELAYNYLMVLAFYLGVAGFLLHAVILSRRGIAWLLLKIGALSRLVRPSDVSAIAPLPAYCPQKPSACGPASPLSGETMSWTQLSLAIATIAYFAEGACAHDYWLLPATFTPDAGKPVSVALHVGDRFVSEGEKAHQAKATVSLKLLSAAAAIDLTAADGDKPAVRFTPGKPGTCIVALERDARLITLPAKKFTAYLKEEGLDSILADRAKSGEAGRDGRERYRRYLKCYLRAGGTGDEAWKKRAGHKLEIVPLSDPTGLKKGDTFAVRVLFDGEPLAGALVTAFSRHGDRVKSRSARTSPKGEARFALSEPGAHLVRLVYMRRAKGDDSADWHSWWSALTCEVR